MLALTRWKILQNNQSHRKHPQHTQKPYICLICVPLDMQQREVHTGVKRRKGEKSSVVLNEGLSWSHSSASSHYNFMKAVEFSKHFQVSLCLNVSCFKQGQPPFGFKKFLAHVGQRPNTASLETLWLNVFTYHYWHIIQSRDTSMFISFNCKAPEEQTSIQYNGFLAASISGHS